MPNFIAIRPAVWISIDNRQTLVLPFIRTKQSERAKRAHSVLREVEKMGYKKFFAHTRIG